MECDTKYGEGNRRVLWQLRGGSLIPIWRRKVKGFLDVVTFTVRPEPSVRICQVVVGTDSQQRFRRERAEGREWWSSRYAWAIELRGNYGVWGGNACWTKVVRTRIHLRAVFLHLWKDIPILWHVGKKNSPFTVYWLLAFLWWSWIRSSKEPMNSFFWKDQQDDWCLTSGKHLEGKIM